MEAAGRTSESLDTSSLSTKDAKKTTEILSKDSSSNETFDPRKETVLAILKHALRNLVNAFALAYGLRTGVSVMLRAIHLLRTSPRSLFSYTQLFSEKNLIVRVDAIRLGLLLGGFTGGFSLVSGLLKKLGIDDRWGNLIGGSIAGLSILFQEKEMRRTLSLYLFVRLLQCAYNSAKSRGWWHMWGSSWTHGDSLLFIITSAQVMYAYVMRPDSIPKSYYKFIVRTGPIAEVVLNEVKNANRGISINVKNLVDYCLKTSKGKLNPQISPNSPIIPCQVLHPMEPSCSKNFLRVLMDTARKIFPLYATLTFVPTVLLKIRTILRSPIGILSKSLLSCLRSTAFLAVFVSTYQATICGHRKVASRDHRFVYFFAGIISSLSILIESKHRRSELALYVLPRALDSWYIQLYDRKVLGSIPGGEALLFCLSVGGLMYFYHNEPETMSPLLKWIIKVIFRPKLV